MGVFRRKARAAIFGPEPIEIERMPEEPPDSDQPPDIEADAGMPDDDSARIKVARTLVMSEPELAELVAAEPRLSAEGIDVSLAEKGFGTRIEIRASDESGLAEDDLEGLLDRLAEPRKRPFSAA
jgi:hypothetical protein